MESSAAKGRIGLCSKNWIFHLFVVLFLVDHNVSIDKQIIEEEELPVWGTFRAFETQIQETVLYSIQYLGLGFFLHAFVKTPSPTKTRPVGKPLWKIKTFQDTPHLVHQGVVLRCQSNLPPGQFVGHSPQNSLHRNTSFKVGCVAS